VIAITSVMNRTAYSGDARGKLCLESLGERSWNYIKQSRRRAAHFRVPRAIGKCVLSRAVCIRRHRVPTSSPFNAIVVGHLRRTFVIEVAASVMTFCYHLACLRPFGPLPRLGVSRLPHPARPSWGWGVLCGMLRDGMSPIVSASNSPESGIGVQNRR
jgi:hypothetical protein